MDKLGIKDLGQIKTCLGLNIDSDHKKNKMTLDQNKYIESLAIKYIIEAKLYNTPTEQNLYLRAT